MLKVNSKILCYDHCKKSSFKTVIRVLFLFSLSCGMRVQVCFSKKCYFQTKSLQIFLSFEVAPKGLKIMSQIKIC